MSPNPDAAEEELPFKEGQILKVCGDKDADGFYRGECAGRTGYIPCNMVSEVQVESEEVRKELLKQGYIPAATSVESIGNGTFAPPPRRLTVPPPKPRRAKKGLWQDRGADLITPRTMVAAFDYNPRESSPNVDVEAELTFTAGDVITVFGSMDDDGFYYVSTASGETCSLKGSFPSTVRIGETGKQNGGLSAGTESPAPTKCFSSSPPFVFPGAHCAGTRRTKRQSQPQSLALKAFYNAGQDHYPQYRDGETEAQEGT
uniref:SH3 domain-containing protein n=1 Tax=Chelonoidis abingdonii TaxID=106734 RepID=A0A8C0INW4_CHEAB